MNTAEYLSIIENIKSEITAAQYHAAVHVNADMLLLYYDIGCVINEQSLLITLQQIFGSLFQKAKVILFVI